jgi:flagellar hook-basal body complex protein FliE
MDVTRIGGALPAAIASATAESSTKATGFAQMLRDALVRVSTLQHEADRAMQALASGERATVQDTLLVLEQAELSFPLMMQVRNRMVEAYQEVLRMQM